MRPSAIVSRTVAIVLALALAIVVLVAVLWQYVIGAAVIAVAWRVMRRTERREIER